MGSFNSTVFNSTTVVLLFLADLDYEVDPLTLLFMPGSEEECGSIVISPDDILENTEMFEILLTEAPGTVLGMIPSAVIAIFDNDSKPNSIVQLYQMTAFCIHTAVDVGFDNTVYSVSEFDEEVEVCATLTGRIAREVRVTMSTRDGSASGDSDYSPRTATERIFEVASQNEEVCWTISIHNDLHLEGVENFFVDLNTDDPQIILSPNTAQIVIMENDSKLHDIICMKNERTIFFHITF